MSYNKVNLGRYRLSPKGRYDENKTYSYLDMVYDDSGVFIMVDNDEDAVGEDPNISPKFEKVIDIDSSVKYETNKNWLAYFNKDGKIAPLAPISDMRNGGDKACQCRI